MKRVLFVSPYFAPAWGYGGPPRINYDLARYLAANGYTVEVATTDALDGQQRAHSLQETLDGITIHRFRNVSNWLAWQGKLFFPLGFGAWLRKNLQRFDFVFLSDFRDAQNAIAYQLCQKFRIPSAVATYGELDRGRNLRTPIKTVYDQLWGRSMLAGARYLLAQTDHEAAEYLRYGGRQEQIVLLPLGIDAKQFTKRPHFPGSTSEVSGHLIGGERGEDFRRDYKILADERLLLYVGRINYLKGIDLLIDGLVKIKQTFPKTRLVIVGRDDGYYLAKLERLIWCHNLTSSVTLTGPLYGEASYGAYRAADLFVFTPRHFEETSLACLTALALGTPVITTHQAGIPYLEEAEAGFEIERDLEIFVEKVSALLKTPKQLEAMGRRGQDLIARVFDLAKVGARFEELINKATHEVSS